MRDLPDVLRWMTDNYGLLVEPHDGRWHAVLSSFDDGAKFEGFGSSPGEATESALKKAEATGEHPREHEANEKPKFDGACPDECSDFDLCRECTRLEEGHVEQIPAEHRIMKIICQQDTPCPKCGEVVEKGVPCKWVRASSVHPYGGIYHSYCCKAV